MRSTPIFKFLSLAVLGGRGDAFGHRGLPVFPPVRVRLRGLHRPGDRQPLRHRLGGPSGDAPADTSGTLLRQVQEGEKVHAGQTVAMAYASKSALEVVSRLEDTELKLQQLQFARSSFLDSDAALKVDSDISDSILRLHIAHGGRRLCHRHPGDVRHENRRAQAQLQL